MGINEALVVDVDDEVQSPYLPETSIQFAWDSTSLGLLKTCPRLYQYVMLDGWTSRDESVHLRFGREYHTALEGYDHSRALGIKHEDAIHDVVRELLIRTADYSPDPETKAGKYKSRSNLVSLVIDYLDRFGETDPAETCILSNGKPAVELSFRFELDFGPLAGKFLGNGQPYLLSGHLDRVVDFNGELMVLDRKTATSTLGPYYFKQYEPNNQMTLYTIAGQIVMNTPIRGIIIDAAQIMLEEPNRFVRGVTYRTPDQIEEWLRDLRVLLAQAEGHASADYWPMNDTACDKFGGCRFREVCSKSPGVRRQFLRADFTQLPLEERWNPLKPR